MAPANTKKRKKEMDVFEENKKLREKLATANLLIQQLQQSQGITRGYIFSTSSAAKNSKDRNKFYADFLCGEEWKGSFVAYKYYIEVVKGARRMTREPQEAATACSGTSIPDKEWENAIEEIDKEAKDLMSSFHDSTEEQYQDAEILQSDILAKLMESALRLLARDKTHGLRVTHQYGINFSVKGEELENSLRKRTTETNEPANIEFVSDVVVWMANRRCGRDLLASFEFKPNNSKSSDRRAQGEMNAFNIVVHRDRPCIAVDVAGGRDFASWVFEAAALVPNPIKAVSKEHQTKYVKSSFLGKPKGAEGILRVAAGLLRGMSYFNDAWLNVLGPTVAVAPPGNDSPRLVNRVVKAYDRSKYCQPNIEWVRKLVDPDAVIWTSRDPDDKIQLVETEQYESDWRKTVPCKSFVSILRHLKELHDAGAVHGDIRLGNMLSSGFLVDLDYVGSQAYPGGLKHIDDGERHPSVKTSIDNESVGSLQPEKKHDLFSMGAVMKLFKLSNTGHESVWRDAYIILEKAGENAIGLALAKLKALDSETVTLTDESMQKIFNTGLTLGGNPQVLLATGGTPEAPGHMELTSPARVVAKRDRFYTN